MRRDGNSEVDGSLTVCFFLAGLLLPSDVLLGDGVVELMPSVSARFVVEICRTADVLIGTSD